MATTAPAREGTIPFRGHHTWYRIVGDHDQPGKLPLLTLHGGPGAAHDYLEPLEALADRGRRVIFYDQLGCGRSSHPHDPSLWTVELFVEEIGAVRRALGLDRIHLLGQSWGGWLGLEYVLTKPAGVESFTIASSAAGIPQWVAEANRLRAALPPEVQQTLLEHEAAGTTGDPAYKAASMVFNRRHVCRLDPWPACMARSFAQMDADPEVYHTMNGPSEFHVIGRLKDWDVSSRLGEIRIPTLITSGRHDESTPALNEALHRGIAGSEWVLFEHSSHTAHIEETERYLQVLVRFLTGVEARLAPAFAPAPS